MKLKSVLLYFIYFTAAVLLFVIVLFPGTQAARSISAQFNRSFEKISFSAEDAKLALPMNVVLPSGELVWLDTQSTKVSQVSVRPSLASVFKPKKYLYFNGRLDSGEFKGGVKGYSFSDSQFEQLDLSVTDAMVKAFEYQVGQDKTTLSFEAGGRCSYHPGTDSAKGTAVLTRVSIDLPETSVLWKNGVTVLDFDRVEIDFEIKKDRLVVKRFTAKGPALNIDLNGEIKLMKKGAVNLKGTFRPAPSFTSRLSKVVSVEKMFKKAKQKGMPLRIKGSVGNPIIGFK